jgi:hypothetical protein
MWPFPTAPAASPVHPKVAELDRRLAVCVAAKLDSAGERRTCLLQEIDRLLDFRLALTGPSRG